MGKVHYIVGIPSPDDIKKQAEKNRNRVIPLRMLVDSIIDEINANSDKINWGTDEVVIVLPRIFMKDAYDGFITSRMRKHYGLLSGIEFNYLDYIASRIYESLPFEIQQSFSRKRISDLKIRFVDGSATQVYCPSYFLYKWEGLEDLVTVISYIGEKGADVVFSTVHKVFGDNTILPKDMYLAYVWNDIYEFSLLAWERAIPESSDTVGYDYFRLPWALLAWQFKKKRNTFAIIEKYYEADKDIYEEDDDNDYDNDYDNEYNDEYYDEYNDEYYDEYNDDYYDEYDDDYYDEYDDDYYDNLEDENVLILEGIGIIPVVYIDDDILSDIVGENTEEWKLVDAHGIIAFQYLEHGERLFNIISLPYQHDLIKEEKEIENVENDKGDPTKDLWKTDDGERFFIIENERTKHKIKVNVDINNGKIVFSNAEPMHYNSIDR